jgi:CHAD domain-containing protein
VTSVTALHDLRVASRRLREVLPVVGESRPGMRRVVRDLRRLTRALGPARELDVAVALLEELARDRRAPEQAIARLRRSMARELRRGRRTLARDLERIDLDRLADRLDRVSAHGTRRAGDVLKTDRARVTRLHWTQVLDVRIARRAAALEQAIEEAGTLYLADRVHRVRIALKKLRYGCELADETAGRRRVTALVAHLKREQDRLGRLHDVQVLIDRTRALQASLSPPSLLAWRQLDSLTQALEDECRTLHAGYVGDRTRLLALCERLARRQAVVDAPLRRSRQRSA